MLGDPAGTGEMGFPRPARPIRLARDVNMQHGPRDLFPVGAIGCGVEQTEIGNQVLLVIAGQNRRGRRGIGDIRIGR
jgi:hypothetical protein